MPLTLTQINTAIQQMTLTALGITFDSSNPSDPAYASVRVDWIMQGQPAFAVTDDVVFVACTEENDEYDRMREFKDTNNPSDSTTVLHTATYTRVWRVAWTIYGPNSFDNARKLRSALYDDPAQMQLAASNLYPVMDIAPPIRAPESFQGQWWERVDFHAFLNEAVEETTVANAVASVEVKTYTPSGMIADQTISD